MPINRLRGDTETIADLADGQPAYCEPQYLNLPITEQVWPMHRSQRLLLSGCDHGPHGAGIQGRRLDLVLQSLDGLS